MSLRHLITVQDFTASEISDLFRMAAQMKSRRGEHPRPLTGKVLGLLFQKPSVRTRISFEVGMAQCGGQSLYVGPVELQQGKREAAKDIAQVLSRYLDALVVRTFGHQEVEAMAAASSVPVINGLSDFTHPCQALADLFTVQERLGSLRGARIAYVGDGNNVCHALMEACALMGVHLSIATAPNYRPHAPTLRRTAGQARKTGGSIHWTENPQEAVRKVQVVYTDVWTSMGQEKQRRQRLRRLRRFQVNSDLMRRAAPGAFFMHCLPAHRGEEVTDEVMDSKRSIVYDQAENRLHVQKAILLKLLSR